MNKKQVINLINKVGIKDIEVQKSSADLASGVFFKLTLKNDKEIFLTQWIELKQIYEVAQIEIWENGNSVDNFTIE